MLSALILAAVLASVALEPSQDLTQRADDPRPIQKHTPGSDRPNKKASAVERTTDPSLEAKTAEGYRWERYATISNAVASIAMAIFTYFLVRVGSIQAHATRQSVEAMRESTKVAADALEHAREAAASSERPWVAANEFTLLEFKVGQRMEAEVRIKNFGSTPALDFTTWGGSSLMPTLGLPSMKPEDQYGPNVLFPTQVVRYPHKLPEALSADQFQAIQSGELYFVVAGRLTYKDQLGRECVTEYCGFYDPHPPGFQMVEGLNRAT